MAIRRFTWLVSVLTLAGCADAAGPDGQAAVVAQTPMRDVFANRGARSFIVTLEEGFRSEDVAREHGIAMDHVYTEALNGFSGALSELARSGLLRDHRVRRVEEDAPLYSDAIEQGNATWGLDRIDQRELPLNGAYAYDTDGQGVTAYVFDTGIRFDHVEFEGRAAPGYDGIGDGLNGDDCNGHGTHVAGTIGGHTYGVAKGVSLVAVRVIGCTGSGSVSTALAGIDWVIRHNQGPAVANFSLTTGYSRTFNDAVETLIAAGVGVAAAAGNNSGDACLLSPASAPGAVTTGAAGTTFVDGILTDSRLSFSNWGSCVDVFAPGTGIMSALISSSTAVGTKSGTSMAAPHVAGVMALWLAQNPAGTPAELHDQVVANATHDIVADAKSDNAHLLYSRLAGEPEIDNSPPQAAFSTACTGRTCSFDASASTATSTSIVRYDWQFGNGNVGSGVLSDHTYASDGAYTVTLTVTDGRGDTGTASSTISVAAGNQLPTAGFVPACEELACSFTDQSTDPDGWITAWAWNFGDGATSPVSNPSHTFALAGTYGVTLQVTDNSGATAVAALEVTVTTNSAPPVADFTFTCTGAACQFNDASVQSVSGIRTWRWSFGDGTISEEQNPAHTYAAAGAYNVRLDVTDDGGAAAYATRTVAIDATRSIPLTATPYKVKGRHTVDLVWSGAAGTSVTLYRDGTVLQIIANTGTFTDRPGGNGRGDYVYRICEADGGLCSADLIVEFR